jgi:AraC family transcriptional regulator
MSLAEQINRVCSHIVQHLDEELSLDQLSRVAAVSKYHLHRVFVAQTGMTLFKFIQLSRLRKASYQLAFNKDTKIIDIALDAGYESPEAFARSFKKTFGRTPSQFRNQPQWLEWQLTQNQLVQPGEREMKVAVVEFKETKVAVLEHCGAPERVMESVEKFIQWRKTTGLSPVKTSQSFGVPFRDPNTAPPEEFRFDICGSIDADVPANEYGVKTGTIPGGRCAMIRHYGSRDTISDSVYSLYRQWLPDSGEEPRDYPCYFRYVNLLPEVDECDLITEIYLPIK